MLTASLELGVRHDGDDTETGFGADIGAGLALAAPSRGLSAELRARELLAHEADSLSRRGLSGTLAFDPAPTQSAASRSASYAQWAHCAYDVRGQARHCARPGTSRGTRRWTPRRNVRSC